MKKVVALTVEEQMLQQEQEEVVHRLYQEKSKLHASAVSRPLTSLSKVEARALKQALKTGRAFNKAQMALERHGMMLNVFPTNYDRAPVVQVENGDRVFNTPVVMNGRVDLIGNSYDAAIKLIFNITREGRVELAQALDKLACFRSLKLKLSAIHVARPWF